MYNSRNREWKNLIFILLGLAFSALAYKLFLIPGGITAGGFTGIAQLLNRLANLPIGAVTLAMNAPLFLMSIKTLGRRFALRSLIVTAAFSLLLDNLNLQSPIQDTWLSTVYGGLLLGLGTGLLLRGGATTGGSEMLASLLHKLIPALRVSYTIFAIDGLVILASAFVFDPTRAMYALICTFITNLVVDFVLEGPSSSYSFFIISDKSEEIAQRVMNELERGVTALEGVGMYSGTQKRVLLCAVSRMESVRLRRIVFTVDPSAFFITTRSHDTYGEGFKELEKL